MKTLRIPVLLVVLLVMLCGCSATSGLPLYEYDADGVILWKSCSPAQAEVLSGSVKDKDILQGAACSSWLLESGVVCSADYAKSSQVRLKKFLDKNPQSGLGHYLLAYLIAKEAQLAPMKGIDLVPLMEQEALKASRFSPELDRGGPDRFLGELYLKAPSAPISIGDMDKSLEHYEKAVEVASDFALNRLGLASALLEDDETEEACVQYGKAQSADGFSDKLLKVDFYKKLAKACAGKKAGE
ncbi:tetratricopeptide repeat protein [Maridesulfovibrio sp.]|uniref:tetratricopeptide repeat protein n=1 Tax=unclassified Maridesulfovibrio TaxID=2794999 RepID=UPI003AFF9EA8